MEQEVWHIVESESLLHFRQVLSHLLNVAYSAVDKNDIWLFGHDLLYSSLTNFKIWMKSDLPQIVKFV